MSKALKRFLRPFEQPHKILNGYAEAGKETGSESVFNGKANAKGKAFKWVTERLSNRLASRLKRVKLNGWTAYQLFRMGSHERLNGLLIIPNG